MRGKWRRLRGDRRGVGALEFALIAPVVLLMLLGIFDFGRAYWEQMQLANAADSGGQWAMQNTYNATDVNNLAENATPLRPAVSSYTAYGCPSGGGVLYGATDSSTGQWQPYSSSSTCPDGTTAQSYVIVNTQICYSTIFHWPGLTYCSGADSACSTCQPSQISLTAQSVVLYQ